MTPGAPDGWDYAENGLFERYRRYAILADQNRYPELYLLHELLIHYLLNDDTSQEIIIELTKEIDDLEDIDAGHFKRTMIAYASNNIGDEPDARSERLASRALGFLEAFHDQHELLEEIYLVVRPGSSEAAKTASLEQQLDRFIAEAAKETEFPLEAVVGDEAEPVLERLEAFVDALLALDLDPERDLKPMIDQVESTFRSRIPENPGISATLTLHYGRRLVGSPEAPADWQREGTESIFSRYRRYADIAHEQGWPEMYLLHELLVQHLEGAAGSDTTVQINQLIGEIDTLNEVDSQAFWDLLKSYASNDLAPFATPEGDSIAQRTIDFLIAHETEHDRFAMILSEIQGPQAQL